MFKVESIFLNGTVGTTTRTLTSRSNLRSPLNSQGKITSPHEGLNFFFSPNSFLIFSRTKTIRSPCIYKYSRWSWSSSPRINTCSIRRNLVAAASAVMRQRQRRRRVTLLLLLLLLLFYSLPVYLPACSSSAYLFLLPPPSSPEADAAGRYLWVYAVARCTLVLFYPNLIHHPFTPSPAPPANLL